MVNIPRRARRRLSIFAVAFLIVFALWNLILLPDSTVRLALHFNAGRLYNTLRASIINKDGWLRKPGRYPIDLKTDVGYLIKTGYGTRDRIPGQIKAFETAGDFLGKENESFIVVGDWTTVSKSDAQHLGVEVHDAIQIFMDTKIDASLRNHPRLQKYGGLQRAIQSGDEDWALHIGQTFGWELDALKFIMGMELLYDAMPDKKWYVILDDDTFVIKASLELFLSHLDYRKPQYIGNAVGDFKGRFAHGGSGVLVSGEAMRRLFERKDIVMRAYLNSLDETWGDKLVATTLQKLGIYIDERYNHHFNGEPPELTRIRADRFCSPLLSFHRLQDPKLMEEVARTLSTGPSSAVTSPVLWGELWQMFAQDPIQKLADQPVRKGADHVGAPDEHVTTSKGVANAESCRGRCQSNGNCLAWTYIEGSKECHQSPWMVIGPHQYSESTDGKWSGVKWKEVERMIWKCS